MSDYIRAVNEMVERTISYENYCLMMEKSFYTRAVNEMVESILFATKQGMNVEDATDQILAGFEEDVRYALHKALKKQKHQNKK